jgi:DNA-binding CsgD family transcriptional regulator
VDVERRYDALLDLFAELLVRPTPEFPLEELTGHLVSSFQTEVSWHWASDDGSFGVQHMSHPIPNWPSSSDLEAWNSGMKVHPLACWMLRVGDQRAMSIGRVPRELVPKEGFGIIRETLGPVGLEEELSIPYEEEEGTYRTVVLSQSGEDYSDEDFDLARRIQPLVQVLARQCRILREARSGPYPHALTGRELAVLGLLRTGGTAAAIGRRLGISPRTVEVHLSHIYRKLDVRDRLQAVLIAEDLRLLPITSATGAFPDTSHRVAPRVPLSHDCPSPTKPE